MKKIEIDISQLQAFLGESNKYTDMCAALFKKHIDDECTELKLDESPAYVGLKKNFPDWIGNALDNEATLVSILLPPLEAKTVGIYIADNGKKYENFPSEGYIDIYENSGGYMWNESKKKNHLLLSEEGQTIEPGNIYLQEIDGYIAYTMIAPKGEVVKDIVTDIEAPERGFILEYLQPLKRDILSTIAQAGHGRIYHGGAGMGGIRVARFLYEYGGKALYVDNQNFEQKVYKTGGVVLLQSARNYQDFTTTKLYQKCASIFSIQATAARSTEDGVRKKWPTATSRLTFNFSASSAPSSDSIVSSGDSHSSSSTSTNSSSSTTVDPQPRSSSSDNSMAFNFSSSSSSSSSSTSSSSNADSSLSSSVSP